MGARRVRAPDRERWRRAPAVALVCLLLFSPAAAPAAAPAVTARGDDVTLTARASATCRELQQDLKRTKALIREFKEQLPSASGSAERYLRRELRKLRERREWLKEQIDQRC